MDCFRSALDQAGSARGTVVVIDVLRAFSTAAYAFGQGAPVIWLAGAVDEALALRDRIPGALVVGEVGGLPVPGFDFSNSPSELAGANLRGHPIIQRTSAGTQGVIRSPHGAEIWAASFCVAGATARALLAARPGSVTFVLTGLGDGLQGDEDAACADYLEALLRGRAPEPAPYLARVAASPSGRRFADPAEPDFPAADLDACMQLDRFNFALRAEVEAGRWRLRAMDHRTNVYDRAA